MNEDLLHFIWKYKLFNVLELTTTLGEPIQIVSAGMHNTNAGADFQNAKIKIGDILWVGSVEIHLKAKDWERHNHHQDPAYNNVILHVVYDDGEYVAKRENGEPVPALVIKNRINANTLSRYLAMEKRIGRVACAPFIGDVESVYKLNALERVLVERLENKVEKIKVLLEESKNNWEQVMFQMLAQYFGAEINKEPFLLLAKSLPVTVLAKHQNNLFQLEALMFGQAGLLEEKTEDEYAEKLRKEYLYLKRLHQLVPLKKHWWKWLRLRPSHFPEVRLAQLAATMHKEVKLFSKMVEIENVNKFSELFTVNISDYWKNHYRIAVPSKTKVPALGKTIKNVLMINVVVPVLFAYGKHKGRPEFCEKALSLLEQSKPERNSIIAEWEKLRFVPENAAQSQALLQLRNEYCNKFRCLDCAIASRVLK